MNKCYIKQEQAKNTLGLLPQIFAGVPVFNSTVGLFHSCFACFLENSVDVNIQAKESKAQCKFQKQNWLYIPQIII